MGDCCILKLDHVSINIVLLGALREILGFWSQLSISFRLWQGLTRKKQAWVVTDLLKVEPDENTTLLRENLCLWLATATSLVTCSFTEMGKSNYLLQTQGGARKEWDLPVLRWGSVGSWASSGPSQTPPVIPSARQNNGTTALMLM